MNLTERFDSVLTLLNGQVDQSLMLRVEIAFLYTEHRKNLNLIKRMKRTIKRLKKTP